MYSLNSVVFKNQDPATSAQWSLPLSTSPGLTLLVLSVQRNEIKQNKLPKHHHCPLYTAHLYSSDGGFKSSVVCGSQSASNLRKNGNKTKMQLPKGSHSLNVVLCCFQNVSLYARSDSGCWWIFYILFRQKKPQVPPSWGGFSSVSTKGSSLKMFLTVKSGRKGVSTPRSEGCWGCPEGAAARTDQNLPVWTELSPGKLFIN